MAVTIPKSKKSETAAPMPEVLDTMPLQLGIYQRYVKDGRVYESGVVYDFLKETALDLLAEEDNGRPLWKVYRPTKGAPEVLGQIVRREAGVKPAPTAQEQAPAVDVKAKRIEIGDDSELTELGLNLAHDGDEDSTGGAVTV